ncbi:hypothetical protein WJX81_001918 [Elliptochloris bilobata]|uniref:Uncharacterized protein n=1 Tax=Elliptochloris bilobata TaxID=381761 RepID=A0AAW1RZJ2_9CHLO
MLRPAAAGTVGCAGGCAPAVEHCSAPVWPALWTQTARYTELAEPRYEPVGAVVTSLERGKEGQAGSPSVQAVLEAAKSAAGAPSVHAIVASDGHTFSARDATAVLLHLVAMHFNPKVPRDGMQASVRILVQRLLRQLHECTPQQLSLTAESLRFLRTHMPGGHAALLHELEAEYASRLPSPGIERSPEDDERPGHVCSGSLARLMRTLHRLDVPPSKKLIAGAETWIARATPAASSEAGEARPGVITALGAVRLLHGFVVCAESSLSQQITQVLKESVAATVAAADMARDFPWPDDPNSRAAYKLLSEALGQARNMETVEATVDIAAPLFNYTNVKAAIISICRLERGQPTAGEQRERVLGKILPALLAQFLAEIQSHWPQEMASVAWSLSTIQHPGLMPVLAAVHHEFMTRPGVWSDLAFMDVLNLLTAASNTGQRPDRQLLKRAADAIVAVGTDGASQTQQEAAHLRSRCLQQALNLGASCEICRPCGGPPSDTCARPYALQTGASPP